MSRSSRRLLGIAILMAAAAAIAVAVFSLQGRDASMRRLAQAGVLRVGFAVEAPFAYVGPDGQVRGLMPDAARDLAKSLGIPRVEFVQTSFLSLTPDLLEHRFDLIGGGFYVTAERQRVMRFSAPLVYSGPALAVRKGNPLHLPSFFELKPGPRLKLAIMDRTGSERRMIDTGYSREMLLLVPDPPAGASAVISGAAQGLVMPVAGIRLLASEHPQDLEVVEGPTQSADWHWGQVAFAFHPDDARLQAAWDAVQSTYLSGSRFRELMATYGFADRDLVAR